MYAERLANGSRFELLRGQREDKPIFRHLMQLYRYDDSEHTGYDPDPHGLFDYAYLDHYWTAGGEAEGRAAFLLKVDGRLAGFVLVGSHTVLSENGPGTRGISEFFVMRKWRRQGVGRAAAEAVFRQYPGRWEVRQERSNPDAPHFWRSVIGRFTNGQYREVDARPPVWDGPVQSFEC